MKEFTETNIKNTLAFLSRTDLKGGEVPAYNEIVLKLNNMLNESGKMPNYGPGVGSFPDGGVVPDGAGTEPVGTVPDGVNTEG